MKEGYWSWWKEQNKDQIDFGIFASFIIIIFIGAISLLFLVIVPFVSIFISKDEHPGIVALLSCFIFFGSILLFMAVQSYRDYRKKKLIDEIKEEYPSMKKSL